MIVKMVVQSVQEIVSKKDGAKYQIAVGFEAPPGKLQQFIKWFLPKDFPSPKPGAILNLELTEIAVDQGKLSVRGLVVA